jgi:hypothetical protein
VQVRDAAGNLVASPTVTWSSLNPAVATVNATGVVTGVGAGQATIVATSGGIKGTALVTVIAAAAPTPVNLWAAAVTGAQGSYQHMYGAWGASASDVFAVGTSGTVWRFNGTSWGSTFVGTWTDLRGVWGTAATDVFAVGYGGSIFHFDGTSWTAMVSGTSSALYAVWGSSSKDVYAVGEYGMIVHYDGTAWSTIPGIPLYTFYSIWGSSSADVYAASGSGLMHFNGTAWSAVAGAEWAYGVWGTSSSSVYTAGGSLRSFNGSTWSTMTGSSGAQALWGSSPSEILAVRSSGQVASWNGTTWSSFATVSDRDLNGVWGTATSDVYATGTNWTLSSGVILRGVRGATVTVTPASPTLTGLGTTRQLTATGFSGANAVSGVTFTWTSSNTSVATVSASGLVTAVGAGSATITATAAGGANASTVVTVSP